MAFADLQARLNASVISRLGDTVVIDGISVKGFFDNAYVQAFDGMGATATALIAPSSACLDTTNTSEVDVNGITYRVRSVQPDGTGITVLLLELQP